MPAASRIFVERPIYERFANAIAQRAGRIRVGRALDAATQIGPHTSAEQRDKTESYIVIDLSTEAVPDPFA